MRVLFVEDDPMLGHAVVQALRETRAMLRLASRARRLGVVIATPERGLAHL